MDEIFLEFAVYPSNIFKGTMPLLELIMTAPLNALSRKAFEFRSQRGLKGGVVLIYEGQAYGWKDGLRDAEHEKPGAIAVDENGVVFIAEGGSEYSGAKAWALHPQHMA